MKPASTMKSGVNASITSASAASNVSRDACVRTEGRSFLDRVFGGAAGQMIAHFVEDAKLSKDDISELRRLLDRKGR